MSNARLIQIAVNKNFWYEISNSLGELLFKRHLADCICQFYDYIQTTYKYRRYAYGWNEKFGQMKSWINNSLKLRCVSIDFET